MKYYFLLILFIPCFSMGQQLADSDFDYPIEAPLFEQGKGPVVAIDQGHNNFHTLNGRYAPFARLLTKDGFRLTSLDGKLDIKKLSQIDILVISNPIHQSNLGNWVLPNPSAYTQTEIDALKNWVRKGGRLFLIADHMPFGGAAANLAEAFGFSFTNGFARFPTQQGFDTFQKTNKTILSHTVTEGVGQVMTFTGQAFQVPKKADGLLRFPNGSYSLEPDTAWRFNESTFRRDISGWYQGALLKAGKGRVAVFGEAAMFTTQLAGAQKMKVGMNTKGAEENPILLRNLMKWLSGKR